MVEEKEIMGRCGDYVDYRIEILEGVAAIRKRPGMYIGSTGSRGLHQLIEELLFFSLSRKSENLEIILEDNNTIYFCDRYYAIPLDIDRKTGKSFLEEIFTTFIDGSIVNGYSHGLVIVSALADLLEVSIYQDNKIYSQVYQRGKAQTEIKIKSNDSDRTGTLIKFQPDKSLFKESTFDLNLLKLRLQQIAYLNPKVKVTFTIAEGKSEYYYPQGISEYLIETNKSITLLNNQAFIFQGKENNIIFEGAFIWSCETKDFFLETFIGAISYQRDWEVNRHQPTQTENFQIMSFVNQKYTPNGGTHIEGVKQGIIRGLEIASQKYYPQQEINLNWHKISRRLIGIVIVSMGQPEFAGATKWELINPEVVPIVKNAVITSFVQYIEQYPDILEALI